MQWNVAHRGRAVNLGVVVLAAGEGTRMRSARPKVLHEICGRSMLRHVLDVAAAQQPDRVAVVIGHAADAVRSVAEDTEPALPLTFVVQAERLGTGHAVLQAAEALSGPGASGNDSPPNTVLILCGDAPLVRSATLQRLLALHSETRGALTVLTMNVPEPFGYGRILRPADDGPAITAIVEEADATPGQRGITEVSTGVMVARAAWLWPTLARLKPSPGGEIYLGDLVEAAEQDGGGVAAMIAEDSDEGLGVNDRLALAYAENVMRHRVRIALMEAGVTLIDPATTYPDATVQVGRDTVVWPGTYLLGHTRVGEGCRIGPGTVLRDAIVGSRCSVELSVVVDSEVGAGSHVGPYAHLRGGTRLGTGVHVGNYAEIKNSSLAAGVRMGHFSYIGDAEVGDGSNIGAGVVTCNFDGQEKHRTVIGSSVFVGSDTMLVAPVRLGDRARTGAGSVVTRDVVAGETVVGVPARPLGPVRHARETNEEARADDPGDRHKPVE